VTVRVVAWKVVSNALQTKPGRCAAILGLSQPVPGSFGSPAYLSDGVGDAVVGQGGGLWAVGGVGGDHIGDIVNNDAAGVGWVPGGNGASKGGDNDGGCELHLDGLLILFTFKSKGGGLER
jgi:hypothetical protein